MKVTTNISRNDAIKLAQDIITNNPTDYALVDVETTGGSATDEVIEVAIIDGLGSLLLHEYYIPSLGVSLAEATKKVHKMDVLTLKSKGAKLFKHNASKIIETLQDKTFVAYNSPSDVRWLEQTASKYDVPLFIDRHICVLDLRRATAEQNQSLKNGGDHYAINDIRITLNHLHDIAQMPEDELESIEDLVSAWQEIKESKSKLNAQEKAINTKILKHIQRNNQREIITRNSYIVGTNISITRPILLCSIDEVPDMLCEPRKVSGSKIKTAISQGIDVAKYVNYTQKQTVSIKKPKF